MPSALVKNLRTKIGNNITVKGDLNIFAKAVESVGYGLDVEGFVVTDSLKIFEHQIKAHRLHLEDTEETELDFKNIEAGTIDLFDAKPATLRNIITNFLTVECTGSEYTTGQVYEIKNSQIGKLFCIDSSLTISPTTSIASLYVDSYGQELYPLIIDIPSSGVTNVHLVLCNTQVVFPSLIVEGNFTIERKGPVRASVLFPEFGIIYGNMYVPADIKVPSTFSFMGQNFDPPNE